MTTQLPQLPSPAVADIAEKSNETMEWLRANIKVGFTDQRGPAWWANAITKAGQWEIPDGSHFPGAVPMAEVRKLLDVPFVKGTVHVTYEDAEGNIQVASDADTQPIVNQLTGGVFSYPKPGYKIHPFLETLHTFIEAIQYDQDVAVGSVGLLRKGGQAFLQAVLPETLEVAGYGYRPYLLGVTSVDLSRSTTLSSGANGAVCDNTVNTAVAEALTKLRVRHTSEMPTVQIARERLGLQLREVGEQIGREIAELCKVDVSATDFRLWLDEMAPPVKRDPKVASGGRAFRNAERKRAEYERLWTEDPKVAPWQGFAFGLLQLDNTYRAWNGKVTGAGGRIEQNFSRLVRGDTGKADVAALAALAKVQDRKTLIPV
jgi:phage/plasmid-like protein (TIGR03299 family)